MLVFKIEEADVKDFMNKLFKNTCFDSFEIRDMEISTLVKFTISGILEKDHVEGAEESQNGNYTTWQQLKPYALDIIKSGKKPKSIKMVFSLNEELTKALHENAKATFLNTIYENNEIICTTATSQRNFSLDKTVDNLWDDYVEGFFRDNQISVSNQLE